MLESCKEVEVANDSLSLHRGEPPRNRWRRWCVCARRVVVLVCVVGVYVWSALCVSGEEGMMVMVVGAREESRQGAARGQGTQEDRQRGGWVPAAGTFICSCLS